MVSGPAPGFARLKHFVTPERGARPACRGGGLPWRLGTAHASTNSVQFEKCANLARIVRYSRMRVRSSCGIAELKWRSQGSIHGAIDGRNHSKAVLNKPPGVFV